MVSNFVFLTLCLVIYFVGTVPFLNMEKPKAVAVVVWVIGIYVLSGILMMLSHGIATLIRKFGPTYGVVMGLRNKLFVPYQTVV